MNIIITIGIICVFIIGFIAGCFTEDPFICIVASLIGLMFIGGTLHYVAKTTYTNKQIVISREDLIKKNLAHYSTTNGQFILNEELQ